MGKLLLGRETDDGCSSLVQEREEIGRLLLELEWEEFGRQSLVLEREDCCLSLVLEVEEMERLSLVLVKDSRDCQRMLEVVRGLSKVVKGSYRLSKVVKGC